MMNTINRNIESLLPFFASSISNLVASLPGRRARGADVAGLSGAAGAGLLTGVAIGLLFAPQSGDETRRQLMSGAGSLRQRLMGSLEKLLPASAAAEETAPVASTEKSASHRETPNGHARRSQKPARA